MESEHLAGVQRALNSDREQCERVKKLWTDLTNYFSDIVEVIECADLSKEPDMKPFRKWVLLAVNKTNSEVAVFAEPLHMLYKEATSKDKCSADDLSSTLLSKAMAMAQEKISFESIFSLIAEQILELPTVAIYLLVTGVGDLGEFIKVLIDTHKGSLSKVAEEIRKLSSQLENEHNKWKKAFENFK